ncbi:MAG: hypothetical protein LBF74_02075, partial [Treponema sp.]|nr:hypothetical protein [Treponema sp.]
MNKSILPLGIGVQEDFPKGKFGSAGIRTPDIHGVNVWKSFITLYHSVKVFGVFLYNTRNYAPFPL